MTHQYHKKNAEIAQLPSYETFEKKILIIKTEDIGDYLLFRNFLTYFRNAEKFKGYQITLLGNSAWKSVFDVYDKDLVDHVIWLDKSKYMHHENYSQKLYAQLRDEKFEYTICPERWRHIAWADCITLAANSLLKFGVKNTDEHTAFNAESDKIYHHIFENSWAITHEFIFNKSYTEWVIEENISIEKPIIPNERKPIFKEKTILFNIAASKKSKRWPIKNWINLIETVKQQYSDYHLAIIGGPMEIKEANIITEATHITSLVNKYSITETIELLNGIALLITNDSFALHAGIGNKTKNIISIANGNNAFRFADYSFLSSNPNESIYPKYYLKKNKSQYFSDRKRWFYDATSTDISTINPNEILDKIKAIL
ncbi:glycosyltransferase family 9 protein [Rhizosphaericola mali]|nr:glycosyltransferase family 9 protein [Rhizosphaericola mali]